MRIPKDGIPVLKGCIVDDSFKAWCPYCRKWHMHGPPEGHRCAHCGPGSPFYDKGTGYYIQLYTKKELKMISTMKEEEIG